MIIIWKKNLRAVGNQWFRVQRKAFFTEQEIKQKFLKVATSKLGPLHNGQVQTINMELS